MPMVYTNVIFERLNDEGKNQLQTAIDEGEEAFWKWIDENNIDSETINEVQYNATQEEISFYLTHAFKQYPDGGWERE